MTLIMSLCIQVPLSKLQAYNFKKFHIFFMHTPSFMLALICIISYYNVNANYLLDGSHGHCGLKAFL